MKGAALFLGFALLLAGSFGTGAQQAQPGTASPWSADISQIRRIAGLIPGRKPSRINVLKFAESHRTKNFSVKGEPATPSVQARTVFQVVYPDGYVMVDAGMDEPMNIIKTGAGLYIEVQGTAEAMPFGREALNRLLDLADTGIRQLIALQRGLVGKILAK